MSTKTKRFILPESEIPTRKKSGIFFQGDHAFQMLGLGEQVKGLDGGDGIPGLVEFRQIPYLGGGIAGNVNDFSGAEGK